jgi:hypothetical protein
MATDGAPTNVWLDGLCWPLWPARFRRRKKYLAIAGRGELAVKRSELLRGPGHPFARARELHTKLVLSSGDARSPFRASVGQRQDASCRPSEFRDCFSENLSSAFVICSET